VVGLIGGCAGILADSGILAAVFGVLGIAVGVTAVSLIEHFFRRSPRDADRPRRRRRRAPTRTQTPIEPAEISTGSITEGGSTTG
jgi:hypothetical protein